MTCAEVVRSLSDYIDGTLAPSQRADVEEHLAGCQSCHLVLDSTQCTIVLYRVARSETLSSARREDLLRRLEIVCRDRRARCSDR